MRIIGGEAKGWRYRLSCDQRVRPTSDFLREALFNILPPITEKRFLDLFAGHGTVGLEALSRGATEVVFVENDPCLAAGLKRILTEFAVRGRGEVILGDALQVLEQLAVQGRVFDFLFADPPYNRGYIGQIGQRLLALQNQGRMIIAPDGLIILQHAKQEDGTLPEALLLTDKRRYGESMISFLKYRKVE